MSTPSDDKSARRYREYLDSELEAAATYRALASVERDPVRVEAFEELAETEMRHAARWAERLGLDPGALAVPRGNLKVRALRAAVGVFGTRRVLPILLRWEASGIETYASDPEAQDLVEEERRHSAVLGAMATDETPRGPGAEPWHLVRYGGSLRAAVLGVNDGLVSNFSLVMGVAGGTDQAGVVLLAGVAGLAAGAFSMAAGEYVSVRSQRELHERELRTEAMELREAPEEEERELTLIYRAKGLSEEAAARLASRVMERPEVALDTMAREELGLDPEQLGSPWGASASSFGAFTAGAVVPILPYIAGAGAWAFSLSAALSGVALLVVGGGLAVLTGRSVAWGALRMLLAGGAAAAVTFGIGRLVGAAILG